MDSSDTLYALDLTSFQMTPYTPREYKERNGKALPGPRDDFCFVTAANCQDRVRSTYLLGGFKNGTKMMDIYKLHINQRDPLFEWELIEVQTQSVPEPRSSLTA